MTQADPARVYGREGHFYFARPKEIESCQAKVEAFTH
jgi:hypothetical protein